MIDVDQQALAIDAGTENDSLMLILVAWLGALGSLLVLAPVVGRAAVLAVSAGALVVAVLIALRPARVAGRAPITLALRAE